MLDVHVNSLCSKVAHKQLVQTSLYLKYTSTEKPRIKKFQIWDSLIQGEWLWTFYTGFPNGDTFNLCYGMIKDSTSIITYGEHDFFLSLKNLVLSCLDSLGLFENDRGHSFGISESAVSNIFLSLDTFFSLLWV